MISTALQKTLLSSLAILIVLLLMILWMAGVFERKIEPGLLPVKAESTRKGYTVQEEEIPLYEEISATVESEQATDIAAQIQARIRAIHVKAGDTVQPGDLLVSLDDESLQARKVQAQANENAVSARLIGAKAHYQRTRDLYAKESATRADLDQAEAAYHSLKSQYSAARQQLREARTFLDYSEIRSPIAARVIDRFAEPGNITQPGMKLLSIYDPNALRIAAYVRETTAVTLKTGMTLNAGLEALKAHVPAVIEEIVPAAQPGARSFLVKLRIGQRPGFLPGMFARIRIPLGTERVILLPKHFIRSIGQLNVVWIEQNKQIIRRFVRLGGGLQNDRVKVIAGLSAGEKVVKPVYNN